MHTQFKEIISKFYGIMVEKKQFSDMFKHALERYLSYSQLQDERQRDKEKDSQQNRSTSFKSAKSNNSKDSFTRIKKLFHSTSLETTLFFCFFLLILKNNKPQFLAFLMQKVSQRMLTVKKRISQEQKKRLESKFNKLYEQLNYLSQRSKTNKKIDWLYLEAFTQFESECILLSQLISSPSDELQHLQNIRASEYATLFSLLKIKCHILDKRTKEWKIMGLGQNKLYIGNRGDGSYFIMSQKQFELELRLCKKEILESRKQVGVEEKGLKELKKLQTIKVKQQFLAEIKQDYEVNTLKIANLFNFKDSSQSSKQVDQARQA